MKAIEAFNSPIQYLFTDIDDTLTEEGRLQEKAFTSLWQLYRAGISIIPVTGRPAGWCELIARQWPVRGVIGENGAFYFTYRNKKMERHFELDPQTRQKNQSKFQKIQEEILRQVPGAALASDQFSRLTDLAIDFCEDVSPLDRASIHDILEIFKRNGATAKISSIHVNGWFGEYDKLSACKAFCSKELCIDFETHLHQMAYIGDSPNDEPMFQAFTHSFGVANLQDFSSDMISLPKYISRLPRGHGFSEISHRLCQLAADGKLS